MCLKKTLKFINYLTVCFLNLVKVLYFYVICKLWYALFKTNLVFLTTSFLFYRIPSRLIHFVKMKMRRDYKAEKDVGGENCKENFHSKAENKKERRAFEVPFSGLELGHETSRAHVAAPPPSRETFSVEVQRQWNHSIRCSYVCRHFKQKQTQSDSEISLIH